jgi:hypothetical protein
MPPVFSSRGCWCGRWWLSMFFRSLMTVCASSSESKASIESTSSADDLVEDADSVVGVDRAGDADREHLNRRKHGSRPR